MRSVIGCILALHTVYYPMGAIGEVLVLQACAMLCDGLQQVKNNDSRLRRNDSTDG